MIFCIISCIPTWGYTRKTQHLGLYSIVNKDGVEEDRGQPRIEESNLFYAANQKKISNPRKGKVYLLKKKNVTIVKALNITPTTQPQNPGAAKTNQLKKTPDFLYYK